MEDCGWLNRSHDLSTSWRLEDEVCVLTNYLELEDRRRYYRELSILEDRSCVVALEPRGMFVPFDSMWRVPTITGDAK
jgi:hypothetical protein